MTNDTTDHLDALSKGLIATDASRRVGWAKAYEAEDRLEAMAADANLFRGDRDAYHRGYSYLLGMLTGYSDNAISETRLGLVEDFGILADPFWFGYGRTDGQTFRASHDLDAEVLAARTYRKEGMKRRKVDHEAAWDSGRFAERKALARRFGFTSVERFFEWLDEQRGTTTPLSYVMKGSRVQRRKEVS